jgi:hypothetical protein
VGPSARFLIVSAALLAAACGKKAESPKGKDAAVTPTVSPIATPPVGIDAVHRMSFSRAGAQSYDKAVASRNKRDWSEVRKNAEAALARDPHHLDPRHLLGIALAKLGEPEAAVEHLVAALAGDHYKYAPLLDKDEELKEFFATPHGASVKEVSAKIKAAYARRIASGVWLVARRSPQSFGAAPSSSRGELYAFDRETKRYLRLSHTEHRVAGFVRSAAANEVLLLGYDKIDRPKPAAKGEDPTPTIKNAWVEVLDSTTWERVGQRAEIGEGREISVGYGPGDQILVSTAPASGRWGVGAPTISSIDRSTGRLTKVTVALPVPRIAFTLDEGRLIRGAGGVTATWTGDPPTAPSLTAGGAAIGVPESGAAAQSTVALSPDKSYVAFATAVDPCAKGVAPSLYVADAKTGALKHLLTERSRFATRWIDATTLAYEDGDGAIRLWDPKRDGRGGQVLRLENKLPEARQNEPKQPALALDVLSREVAPLCKQQQQQPAAEPGSGSGDEPAMPPEEPAGSGAAP